MRFELFGTRFHLPLLTLLTPLLAMRLGLRMDIFALFIALSMHELAHIIAARMLRVEIHEVRLMPFGGSAKMENPYGLRPTQLFGVAAAGPLMNLLLCLIFASLAQWGMLDTHSAADHVRIHLLLMVFNLLPALPLDGGRMLYALLQRWLGCARAVKFGLIMGIILSLALLSATISGFISTGKINLSFILSAIFILSSARDEQTALYQSGLGRLYAYDAILPLRLYQLPSSTPAIEALRLMRPREACWFVLTHNKHACAAIDGQRLLEALHVGIDCHLPLERLPKLKIT